MNTITLKLNNKQIEKLKHTFKENIISKEIPYVLFQLKLEGCTITAYTSNKVVFQGKDAHIYASSFKSDSFEDQAGSDEVGTGDYFGPITVCACIVRKKDIDLLKKYKVQDSKTLTDESILEIAPKLIKKLDYSILIVDNLKYNEIHKKYNMNQIKAKLHNQAYLNLKRKYILPNFIIIDQFTPKDNYFKYLDGEKEIIENIYFETKAEDKYISVACASIIARYYFLKKWEDMEKEYNFQFYKGAGEKVDKNAALFVKKYGIKNLKNVAKLHFKNSEKLKLYLD